MTMNIEEFRDFCIVKKGVTEETPFGPDTLVFKVMGKIFALSGIDHFEFINLKFDPDYAQELRANYVGVKPAYQANKRLWNSVYINQDVEDKVIYQLIDDSYNLARANLSKKLQKQLLEL